MAKAGPHQQYQVLARWCANQVNIHTGSIGLDESRKGGHIAATRVVAELCQRLAKVGLGEFIADIDIDSYHTARQAVALLAKWKKDLTQRYEEAERIAVAERQQQAAEKAASIAKRVEASEALEAKASSGEQEPTIPVDSDPPKELPKRIERAYRSFVLAAEQSGDGSTDLEAYNWLRENGPEGYDLPEFETWQRYVRRGRNHYRTQKNSPRAGRAGRSIVSPDEL